MTGRFGEPPGQPNPRWLAPRWPTSRLVAALLRSATPVAYLRLGPHSARAELVDALVVHHGGIRISVDTVAERGTPSGERLPRAGERESGTDGGRLFVATLPPGSLPSLEAVSPPGDLGADDRLLLLGSEPWGPDTSTAAVLDPGCVRFDREAIREAAPWVDDDLARRILGATGGWPGPTLFLCGVDDPISFLGASPSLSYSLRLLGPPAVERLDPHPAALTWRLRRSLLALARLVTAPAREATKDELIATLFPDADRDAVARNFHPVLSDLRRTLAGGLDPALRARVFESRHGTYRLDPATTWQLDTDRFERAAAESADAEQRGEVERALTAGRRAWASYGGDFLEGFDGDWPSAERQRLRLLRLGVLRRVGDLAFARDQGALALDAYRALLVEEPYEETVHLAVMELYSRSGRRDRVRRQFVRLQGLLKDLRVEPSPETQRRYHHLMG